MTAPDHQGSEVRACPPLAGMLLAGGIMLVAALVQCSTGLAEVLQWQRNAGSGVRWLTSHLCHWSWNHLAWDVFAFGLLSLLSLRVAPSRYVFSLLVAAMVIPLEILINQPMLDSYRGLSGIDCALFGLIVVALWQQPSGDRRGLSAKIMAVLGGGGFLAKTLYELITGSTLFVETAPESLVPAISAHLVGFFCGAVAGLAKPLRASQPDHRESRTEAGHEGSRQALVRLFPGKPQSIISSGLPQEHPAGIPPG